MCAASDDGRPPKPYIYGNAAFNEKYYSRYADRPLREYVSSVIVSADLKTGNAFIGFIPSQTDANPMNDNGVRRNLVQKARDVGLLKNILGETYDGDDIIMMLVENYPALKEGAASEDLPLEE